jgi:hypothetical protein
MHSALRILGYNDTHHMNTVIQNPSEIDAWTAAINAKFYGRGKPYGRAEWDALLGNFQVRNRKIRLRKNSAMVARL